MFNLYELEQFVAFSKYGSLAKASEVLHISSPTLSRSMQNIEKEFGVPLFNRAKNRLTLNETGKLAAKKAEDFLISSNTMVQHVKEYDESLKSIIIQSCAPIPLWQLLNQIGSIYPNISIHSSICDIKNMNTHNDIYILPYEMKEAGYQNIPYIKEHLYISVPKDHKLALKKNVSFHELNGYDFLLRADIGFWESLCKKYMPDSKFFVQSDVYAISELIKNSSIPNFVSNYSMNNPEYTKDRIVIPIEDDTAHIQFYLAIKECIKLSSLIHMLKQN